MLGVSIVASAYQWLGNMYTLANSTKLTARSWARDSHNKNTQQFISAILAHRYVYIFMCGYIAILVCIYMCLGVTAVARALVATKHILTPEYHSIVGTGSDQNRQ
jgi:uncharacterized membrane protein HdeD (DUF308 family)